MPKRNVSVPINCNNKTCGKCEFLVEFVCVLFSDKKNPGEGTKLKRTKTSVSRCAKCLNQEIPREWEDSSDEPEDDESEDEDEDEDEEEDEDEDEDEEEDEDEDEEDD